MIFNTYQTITLATLTWLLGYFLVKHIRILNKYNIPEPVVGGFVVAIGITVLHYSHNLTFQFNNDFQNTMMLVFFSAIGLSANFSNLIKGGKPLVVFLVIAFGLILLQNLLSILVALGLNLKPAYGLIAGSMTLTGGHGTGIAWAETLVKDFNIQGGLELAMACATFGLVAGGVLGGPVASILLKKIHRPSLNPLTNENSDEVTEIFEKPECRRKANLHSLMECLAMFAVCLWLGQIFDELTQGTILQLPTFVWCLFSGVLIRNILSSVINFKEADESIDLLGSVGLSLFLTIALMSLKLWQLTGLALPIVAILALQIILMVSYAIFITYRFMGKDYDAIVLSAGHCGFGLGATPTAIANMQSVTDHFGDSHKAFLIVPMVGAFFIDLLNAVALKIFTEVIHYL